MNPLSLILIGLGLIMIYIGWKGSQHTIIADLLGHPSTSAQRSNSNSAQPSGNTPAKSSTPPTSSGFHLPTGLPGLGLGL